VIIGESLINMVDDGDVELWRRNSKLPRAGRAWKDWRPRPSAVNEERLCLLASMTGWTEEDAVV